MKEALRKSIIRTLAYFDVYDHPLTMVELQRLLWRHPRVSLQRLADALAHGGQIGYGDGFYFLSGRNAIVARRQARVALVEDKMAIAVSGIQKMRWIPFVRSVFVCNTLSGGWVRVESDIDVFVVVRSGRMWLARLFVTIAMSLFGVRRNRKAVQDKICLSFYVSDEHLGLWDVTIDRPDIYMAYWLCMLLPVYDPDNLLDEIQRANMWVREFVQNGFQPFSVLHRWRVVDSSLSGGVKQFFEHMWGGRYGNFLESQAKGAQKARMKLVSGSLSDEPDTRVVISDSILKFHENDRREAYREQWKRICEEHSLGDDG